MFGTPRLGVRARFLALALVAVVGCALMAVLIYDRAAKATFQMRESQARAAVQDTLGALRPLLAEAARGTLSLVEAQAEVRSRIATTRFHAPMTVFALDPETGVVAHGPSRASWEATGQSTSTSRHRPCRPRRQTVASCRAAYCTRLALPRQDHQKTSAFCRNSGLGTG